jgi:serine/threonine protein kinase
MATIDVGTLLGGKYRLEKLIGRGGMGSVWRAEHLGLTAPVAIKLLDIGEWAPDADALARFHREARAAASIRSPHVVQILDHGIDTALAAPYIVMELMEGESLAHRLTRLGRISPAETARVMTHVARALSRAHEAGIVHRDLKPDNVFLVRNEDEEVAKVLDFGIAKAQAHALGGDSATRTGAVMGTAYYMSPEQISGRKTVDLRTDLWAFGVMTYECITGLRPFDADSIGGLTLKICIEPLPVPSQHAPVPAGFDAWFLRLVDRDPSQRFASAREAAETLRTICSGAAPGLASGSTPAHSGRSMAATPSPGVHGSGSGSVAASTAASLSRSASDASVGRKPSPLLPLLLGLGMLLVSGAVISAGLWFWRSKAAADARLEPSAPVTGAAAVGRPSVVQPEPTAAPAEPVPPAAPSSTAPAASSSASSANAASPKISAGARKAKLSPVASPKVSAPAKPKPPAERDVIDDRH